MSTSNPSHALINRNPRSLAHPQLAPTVSGGIHHQTSPLPSAHLGPWGDKPLGFARGAGVSGENLTALHDDGDEEEEEEEEEHVDVHQTFLPDAEMLGRVKVIVGRYEFWCHKEVLWFASPFFKGLLQGNWAETNPLRSASPPGETSLDSTTSPTDIDGTLPLPTATRPPISSAQSWVSSIPDESQEEARNSIYLDAQEGEGEPQSGEVDLAEVLRELSSIPDAPSANAAATVGMPTLGNALPGTPAPLATANPMETIASPSALHSPLLDHHPSPLPRSPRRNSRRRSTIRHSFSSVRPASRGIYGLRVDSRPEPEAVVELHEESAAAFQDFLFWAYPHLECKVTWTNVENLLALAMKLLVPPLQKLCLQFLMTHASGRPVIALALAEQYGNTDLYREASRFVLDQPTWSAEDLDTLSEQTQLKLSQKRTWFLERLLKLGSIDVRKEYQCRPDCPTPDKCQVLLDDKWRQAHSAVSRYGPPQPSVAFRCLRQLETFPTNPSLVMAHPMCQTAAKTWVTTLFDRMFQLKVLPSPSSPGTEKYWLWITLR